MKYKIILAILVIFTAMPTLAQHMDAHHHLHGMVRGIVPHESRQDTIPLAGANVWWLGTQSGTTTDASGMFQLNKPEATDLDLIISYVEYKTDTVTIKAQDKHVHITLAAIRESESVEVSASKPNSYQVMDAAVNTQMITQSGLQTMACCDLSESFENTTAVDVEQNDAVSGAKQIKMLGLAGYYTQILVEKKPVLRGLVSPFALEYIPGAWMESISISKGTASVMTGYESTTGQINIEFRKPEDDKPVFLNAYQNSMGKSEASFIGSKRVNKKISTMLLAYGNMVRTRHDENSDTFLDMPLGEHVHLMNRWKLENTNGWAAQLGVKYLLDNRNGGQSGYQFDRPVSNQSAYGFQTETRRLEVYSKLGKRLNYTGSQSIGLILSAFRHQNDGFWGMKTYDGTENSIYANLIYRHALDQHEISTGVSYTRDDIDEFYNHTPFKRTEKVPGVFAEYTFTPSPRLTAIAGFRYDRHNLYGDFYTPRLHIKYLLTDASTIRLSAGKGYKSPYIFMENLAILASSRELHILEEPKAEEAINYGLQFNQDFSLGSNRPVSLLIDFYRTSFQNRIIVDMEQNAGQIYLYNLNGESYSNSLQMELSATLFRGLESTIGWHYNDVKMTIQNELLEQPLTNRHKGLLVLSYTTNNGKWQFDFTTQLNGKSRLPNTRNNPQNYQVREYSPRHALLFAQVKRKINRYELYMGMENITNYVQNDPILAWQEPFSPYFDSSMIWGPTIGRRIYAGIRIN